MIRVKQPALDIHDTLLACIDTTNDDILRQKQKLARSEFLNQSLLYRTYGASRRLYEIKPLDRSLGEDVVVHGNLTKRELVRMYDQLRRGTIGRDLYDELQTAVHKCPYCGGAGGAPRNLDHYLPKALFPQFSILPENLIPSCTDCNIRAKGDAYPNNETEQIIHPILDKQEFFDQQWIFAEYIHVESLPTPFCQFFARPPADWSEVDKQRALTHFRQFDLGRLYSEMAASEEPYILSYIPDTDLKKYRRKFLFPPIRRSRLINDWKKVMYEALRDATDEMLLELKIKIGL